MEKISKATKKNWNKLNIDESTKKLEHRANKTMSKKKIIPKELFNNKNNIKIVKEYVDYINETFKDYDLKKIMRTFCIKWLLQNGLINDNLETQKKFVNEFVVSNKDIYNEIFKFKLPNDEDDILGILYQCFQIEGEKNKNGVYYTPRNIVNNMIYQMELNDNTKLLDPCCGTGTFLCKSNLKNPSNLWGIDIDEIAIMIAKVNLFIKYKEHEFKPNLFILDFLQEECKNVLKNDFDYIITNPPWGADVSYVNKTMFREIRSEESFSYMLVNSKKYLKEGGSLIFLLPESFLNVKIHSDIREYLLKRMNIEKITIFPSYFSGVLTKFISIKAKKYELENYNFEIENIGNETIYITEYNEICNNHNYVIPILSYIDKRILKKVYNIKYDTLRDSEWALGIVTGDNNSKLKDFQLDNFEPIYTGKEISEYRLMPVKKYIKYNRDEFQQVASDKYYRAEEKLVYKFISNNLIFAYDNKKSLFLNSANILIPNIDGMSIKTCMAFLNSKLFKYIYKKQFGEIKILKGNLKQMPFPIISSEKNKQIESMCDFILNGNDNYKNRVNYEIYKIFNLTEEEIQYVEKSIR